MFARIERAVYTLWMLGIIHADLQPSNILYDRLEDRVTIIDFGMAVKIPDNGPSPLYPSSSHHRRCGPLVRDLESRPLHFHQYQFAGSLQTFHAGWTLFEAPVGTRHRPPKHRYSSRQRMGDCLKPPQTPTAAAPRRLGRQLHTVTFIYSATRVVGTDSCARRSSPPIGRPARRPPYRLSETLRLGRASSIYILSTRLLPLRWGFHILQVIMPVSWVQAFSCLVQDAR